MSSAVSQPDPVRPVPWWQARLPLFLVGAVFVASAIAKLMGMGGFSRYLVDQGLAPDLMTAAWQAQALIALELFIGLMLFQKAWVARLILPATIAMLVIFSLYLAYTAFLRGDTGNCHCLGEVLPMTPRQSLGKNLVLLGLCCWGYTCSRSWSRGGWKVPLLLAVVSIGITLVTAPEVVAAPSPGVATDPAEPSRFAQFSGFTDAPDADLTDGTVLVLLVSLDCEHCREVTSDLVAADRTAPLPSIYMICLGDEEALMEFQFMTEAMYPSLIVEPETFFQFIGQAPPRLYLLQDGHVIQSWDQEAFSTATVREAVTALE